MTKDTARNMELLINSLRVHQKYQHQDYLDKLEILDQIPSSFKTKYLPIDWLVWYDHYQMETRESNFFYDYTVVMAHYMKEIGKNDQKLLVQLPWENNWHLFSDDAHKITTSTGAPNKNQILQKIL